MTKYFVWIKNQYGLPEAQIWNGKHTDVNGKAKETLAIHEMTPEEGKLEVKTLADLYPFEVKNDI